MTSPASAARRAGAAAGLLTVAALAAACGSVGSNSAAGPASTAASSGATSPAGPASPTSLTPSQPPSSAATPPCPTSGLNAAIPRGAGGAAAGSTYYPLNLTNTSGKSCSLYGYPGVSFVTGPGGSQISQPASRNPVVTPATVVLGPGQVAHVTLQVVDALNYSQSTCKPVTAHWLKIYPPGQYTALYVKFSAVTCSAKLPAKMGSPMSVDAVKAGAGKPGAGL